jgi:hypothetical protein
VLNDPVIRSYIDHEQLGQGILYMMLNDWEDYRDNFLTEWTNIMIGLGVFSRYSDIKWGKALDY